MDDAVYIKGRKINDIEYSSLAMFFGEKRIDRGLWNAVLYKVAQSEDTAVRRLILGVVLDGPRKHVDFKRERESCARARTIIHAMKRKTGRAGVLWHVEAALLYLRHAVYSTPALIFMLVVCVGLAVFSGF